MLESGELKGAVTDYLLHEAPDDDYATFLDELFYKVPDGARTEQATFIIEHHSPSDVAYAFYVAAVEAVPTFQQLVKALSDLWEYEDWKLDLTFWLRAHATPERLRDIAYSLDILESDAFLDLAEQLPEAVTPRRLLAVWNEVAGPSPTDITDQEWALLEPLIPRATNASAPHVVRGRSTGCCGVRRIRGIRQCQVDTAVQHWSRLGRVTTSILEFRSNACRTPGKPGAERGGSVVAGNGSAIATIGEKADAGAVSLAACLPAR